MRLWPLGAQTTVLVFELLPGSVYHLDLTAHGVPKDARLAYINYTPQGPGLFPVEIHGNEPLRRNSGTTRVIFPAELAPSSDPRGPTKVAAMVAWMPPGESSVAWKSLVAAFESYSQGDFTSMVIPANSAVEVELSTLLRRVLESTCGKDRVSDFLKSAATYSYQLNILLPVFAKWLGMPPMPDALRGRLNELRGERNAIAHGGAPEHEIDEKRAGELLCSALFGFKYVRMLASPKVSGG